MYNNMNTLQRDMAPTPLATDAARKPPTFVEVELDSQFVSGKVS